MKYNQTVARSQSSVAFSSLTDLQTQTLNSLVIGTGACLLVAGLGIQDDWMPLRMFCVFAGGVFGGKSLNDELYSIVRTWFTPKPIVEVTHVGETLAERQARMEVLSLLADSRAIYGNDSRQIASDDRLGASWGSTRRLRVVKYLQQHTFTQRTGASRGTFLRDYTLSEAIVALRNKSLMLKIEAE